MSANLSRIEASAKSFTISTIRDPQGVLDLRYGVWAQGDAKPKQFVVFANGRTEWIEKYSYLPQDLGLAKNQGFITWDHRGQGASGGARAHTQDYGELAADAAKVIEATTHGLPYVVVTHSMGGLIMLTAIMNGLIKPKALLMSSPLLGLPQKPLPTVIAKPLARLCTTLGLGAVHIPSVGEFEKAPFASNLLTSSPELYSRIRASPYPCPSPTFGWLDATYRAFDYCHDPKNLAAYTIPTLIMVGDQEKVVDLAGIRAWMAGVQKHSTAKVSLTQFEGARHELFSEVDLHYRKATALAQTWLRETLGS